MDCLKNGFLAALCLAVLIGCGPTDDEQRIGEEASAVHGKILRAAADLAGTKSNLTGFLIGDARAIKACHVKEESALISHTFDELEQEITAHLAASESLAKTFHADAAYATIDDQLAAHRALATKAEAAGTSARELYALLRASVVERDTFKLRADQSVSRIFETSRSVVPLYNYQKTLPGGAANADQRMADLNGLVAQAIRLNESITAGFSQTQNGGLINCSAWAMDILRLEQLSGDVSTSVAALKTLWQIPQ